jgi:plastocyanin
MSGLPRTTPVAALVAGSLIFAGCGGGGSKTTAEPAAPTSPSASVKTIVVEETEFRMKPSTSRVKLGTYTFKGVNRGTIPHVLELEGPGLENETPTINPGESATLGLTLRNPGKYVLYCPLDRHKQKGMKATFIVER